jgi:hypothetical protein
MVFIDKNGHGGWGLRNLNIKDQWNDLFLTRVDTSACTYDPTYDNGSDPDCVKTEVTLRPSKLNGIKRNMLEAGKNNENLYMTFCSGSDAPSKSNRNIGAIINPQVQTFIREQDADRQTFGVVIFDFPNAGIIQSLIQHNPGTPKICATVENEDQTRSDTVYEGGKGYYLGSYWNDNIGYVHLSRACYMSVYVDYHYEGTHNYLLHKKDRPDISESSNDYLIDNNGWIGRWWANDISSYKCYCQN